MPRLRLLVGSCLCSALQVSLAAQLQFHPVYANSAGIGGAFAASAGALHVLTSTLPVPLFWPPLITWQYRKSTDGGRTWLPSPTLAPFTAYDVRFQVSGSSVYLIGATTVVSSIDEGETWRAAPIPLGLGIDDFVAAGATAHAILTTSSAPLDGYYTRTQDGGLTWSAPLQLVSAATRAPRIFDVGGVLHAWWVKGSRIEYQRSSDGGNTWLAVPTVLGANGSGAKFGFQVSGNLSLAIWGDNQGLSFSRSADAGVTWSPPATLPAALFCGPICISDPNIYCPVRNALPGLPGLGMLRSNDAGQSWSIASIDPTYVQGVVGMAAHGGVACVAWVRDSAAVGINNRSIAVSSDAGATWQVAAGPGLGMASTLDMVRIVLAPPVITVAWSAEGATPWPGYGWLGSHFDASGDLGNTWHLQAGTGFYDAPLATIETSQGLGVVQSSGFFVGMTPTILAYANLYGFERLGPSKHGTNGSRRVSRRPALRSSGTRSPSRSPTRSAARSHCTASVSPAKRTRRSAVACCCSRRRRWRSGASRTARLVRRAQVRSRYRSRSRPSQRCISSTSRFRASCSMPTPPRVSHRPRA